MLNTLEKKFGKVYTPKDMAKYLGVDEGTVKKYYAELGGMRLGRRYLFFEKRIERLVNDAVLRQEKTGMGGLREDEGTEETKILPDKNSCSGMGSDAKKATKKELRARDTYNLLA